jgi:hypothetical protein
MTDQKDVAREEKQDDGGAVTRRVLMLQGAGVEQKGRPGRQNEASEWGGV